MASELHHEIILDILLRLPVKSLGRFRCVSKLWLDSICDPTFIKSHLDRAIHGDSCNLFLASEPRLIKNKPSNIRQTHIYSVQGSAFDKLVEIENPFGLLCYPENPYYDASYDSRVLGTCNGLVCLVKRNEICLLNPCSREYKIVKFDKVFNHNSANYGLGYDQVNEDYKLVEFVNRRNSNGSIDSAVNIYSLNDTSCSTIVNVPYTCCYYGICSEYGIYLNGYVHWVAITEHYSTKIVSINVRENVIREIPRPVDVDKGAKLTLGVLRGQLCVLCKFYNIDIEIWAMKNYGASDSWIKLLSMEKTILPNVVAPSNPLCLPDSGKLLLKDGIKPVIYDPEQKTFRGVSFHGINWPYMCLMMTHVASLVPLNSSAYLGTVSRVVSSKKRKGRG